MIYSNLLISEKYCEIDKELVENQNNTNFFIS